MIPQYATAILLGLSEAYGPLIAYLTVAAGLGLAVAVLFWLSRRPQPVRNRQPTGVTPLDGVASAVLFLVLVPAVAWLAIVLGIMSPAMIIFTVVAVLVMAMIS